jgi:hypothetical protein
MTDNDSSIAKRLFSNRAGIIAVLALIGIILTIVFPAIQQVRLAARRSLSVNTVRQIALAFHNYESAHGRLPSATSRFGNGDENFGWELKVLPFMQSSSVYDMVDKNHPWDHPINLPIFRNRNWSCESPHIDFKFNSDGLALSQYSAVVEIIPNGSSNQLAELDGNSEMLGEISAAFPPWGKPGNARSISQGIGFDEKSFGNPELNGCVFGYVDGSAKYCEHKGSTPLRASKISTYHNDFPVNIRTPFWQLENYCFVSTLNPITDKWILWLMFTKGFDLKLVDDEALAQLSESAPDKIEAISVRGSHMITPSGLSQLGKINSLETLSITKMPIENNVLESFMQLKNLNHLILYQCDVDKEHLDSFKEAAPNCKVEQFDYVH